MRRPPRIRLRRPRIRLRRPRIRLHRLGQVGLSLLALTAMFPFAQALLVRALRDDRWFEGTLAVIYGAPQASAAALAAAGSGSTRFAIDLSRARGQVDPRFLSVSIDTAQVVGGRFWSPRGDVELVRGQRRTAPFDFARARLIALTRALAPAYLRIGGTEADFVRYDLSARPAATSGDDSVLTRSEWDALHTFRQQTGLELFFTVNAGNADRTSGAFTGKNVERLLSYSAEHAQRVGVWELGNEVNAFWLTLGPMQHVGASRYARDLRVFDRLVHRYQPHARIAAGAAFVWPLMGEPAPQLLPELTRLAGGELDVLTWHYYPKQSRRCMLASRRAHPGTLLQPHELDEFTRWADHVSGLRNASAPGAETWLGETGGAQCGGEPGDSDRFASSLWWLDQLGSAARAGQRVVVRQTLTGSDYGLLDERSLEPRPDYLASLLWKRTMGERVLSMSGQGDPALRGYAHCSAAQAHLPAGSVSVLLVNGSTRADVSAHLPAWAAGPAELYRVTAPSLSATRAQLNGQMVSFDGDAFALTPRPMAAVPDARLSLPPASYTFAVFPEAHAAACL